MIPALRLQKWVSRPKWLYSLNIRWGSMKEEKFPPCLFLTLLACSAMYIKQVNKRRTWCQTQRLQDRWWNGQNKACMISWVREKGHGKFGIWKDKKTIYRETGRANAGWTFSIWDIEEGNWGFEHTNCVESIPHPYSVHNTFMFFIVTLNERFLLLWQYTVLELGVSYSSLF